MSVRLSTARPRACSGDIYAAVPRITHLRGSSSQRGGLIGITRRGGVGCLRQAEVQDLDGPVLPHFDVGGLQVAVDDPGLVGRLQCLGDLLGNGQGFIDWDRAPLDTVLQGRAFDQLED